MSKNHLVLVLLTRSPEKGKVKTRLIPELGEEAATNIHKELVSITLNTIEQCDFLDKQIWLKGKQSVFDMCFQHSLPVYKQVSNDLGKNMYEAARSALLEYEQVILIGSDCPYLSVDDIQQASDDLNNGSDLVLGPAEDGGYYLIAFKSLCPEFFSYIEWGKNTVFSDTFNKAQSSALKVSLLNMHYDIDTPEDYARFKC